MTMSVMPQTFSLFSTSPHGNQNTLSSPTTVSTTVMTTAPYAPAFCSTSPSSTRSSGDSEDFQGGRRAPLMRANANAPTRSNNKLSTRNTNTHHNTTTTPTTTTTTTNNNNNNSNTNPSHEKMKKSGKSMSGWVPKNRAGDERRQEDHHQHRRRSDTSSLREQEAVGRVEVEYNEDGGGFTVLGDCEISSGEESLRSSHAVAQRGARHSADKTPNGASSAPTGYHHDHSNHNGNRHHHQNTIHNNQHQHNGLSRDKRLHQDFKALTKAERQRVVQREAADSDLLARTVHLRFLPTSMKQGELAALCSECGPYLRVRICGNSTDNQNWIYGFVEFETKEGACKLMQMNGRELSNGEGRPLLRLKCHTANQPIVDRVFHDADPASNSPCIFGQGSFENRTLKDALDSYFNLKAKEQRQAQGLVGVNPNSGDQTSGMSSLSVAGATAAVGLLGTVSSSSSTTPSPPPFPQTGFTPGAAIHHRGFSTDDLPLTTTGVACRSADSQELAGVTSTTTNLNSPTSSTGAEKAMGMATRGRLRPDAEDFVPLSQGFSATTSVSSHAAAAHAVVANTFPAAAAAVAAAAYMSAGAAGVNAGGDSLGDVDFQHNFSVSNPPTPQIPLHSPPAYLMLPPLSGCGGAADDESPLPFSITAVHSDSGASHRLSLLQQQPQQHHDHPDHDDPPHPLPPPHHHQHGMNSAQESTTTTTTATDCTTTNGNERMYGSHTTPHAVPGGPAPPLPSTEHHPTAADSIDVLLSRTMETMMVSHLAINGEEVAQLCVDLIQRAMQQGSAYMVSRQQFFDTAGTLEHLLDKLGTHEALTGRAADTGARDYTSELPQKVTQLRLLANLMLSLLHLAKRSVRDALPFTHALIRCVMEVPQEPLEPPRPMLTAMPTLTLSSSTSVAGAVASNALPSALRASGSDPLHHHHNSPPADTNNNNNNNDGSVATTEDLLALMSPRGGFFHTTTDMGSGVLPDGEALLHHIIPSDEDADEKEVEKEREAAAALAAEAEAHRLLSGEPNSPTVVQVPNPHYAEQMALYHRDVQFHRYVLNVLVCAGVGLEEVMPALAAQMYASAVHRAEKVLRIRCEAVERCAAGMADAATNGLRRLRGDSNPVAMTSSVTAGGPGTSYPRLGDDVLQRLSPSIAAALLLPSAASIIPLQKGQASILQNKSNNAASPGTGTGTTAAAYSSCDTPTVAAVPAEMNVDSTEEVVTPATTMTGISGGGRDVTVFPRLFFQSAALFLQQQQQQSLSSSIEEERFWQTLPPLHMMNYFTDTPLMDEICCGLSATAQ